jgi:hypothetical protein
MRRFIMALPALAAGVTVIFRRSPRPAFETFTWSQEIEITRPETRTGRPS